MFSSDNGDLVTSKQSGRSSHDMTGWQGGGLSGAGGSRSRGGVFAWLLLDNGSCGVES